MSSTRPHIDLSVNLSYNPSLDEETRTATAHLQKFVAMTFDIAIGPQSSTSSYKTFLQDLCVMIRRLLLADPNSGRG